MTFKLSHSVQLVTLILYHVTLGNSTTSTSRSPTKTFTTTSTTLADAKTTSVLGGSNCAANCTLTYYEFGKMSWAPIKLSTTYTHTVILVVDEEHHTTRTSTELVAIPPSVNTHNLLPTNSAGTVIASLGGGTFLTYPTNTIFYPTDVNAGGTYSTSDRCVTLPAKITWPSSALSSLTQDEATFPTGETDRFGILYTLKNIGTFYPSAFLEAQTRAGIIPSQCKSVAVAPATAVQGVLVLTSTSISTIQNTKTSDQTSKTTANPIKQTTTSSVLVPTQSNSVKSTTSVPPPTSPVPTSPLSTKSTALKSQPTISGTTTQPLVSPPLGTSVRTGTSIMTTQASTTGNTATAVATPLATSTSRSMPASPDSSIIVGSMPSSLASFTVLSSTGLDVGDYIMSGLGGLPTLSLSSGIASGPAPSTLFSTASLLSSSSSTTASNSISFSLSTPSPTLASNPSPAQVTTSSAGNINRTMKGLVVASGVLLILMLYA